MTSHRKSESETSSELATPPGLGDLAAKFFTSLGITEERYRSAKVKLHLDPSCNCADRRRWLNEIGAKLGVNGVVPKLARWMDSNSVKTK
jgi:hypothetical protein